MHNTSSYIAHCKRNIYCRALCDEVVLEVALVHANRRVTLSTRPAFETEPRAQTTARSSSSARPFPTQFIGPYDNGMNALSLCTNGAPDGNATERVAEESDAARSQRSGQNEWECGKKLRASRWNQQRT